MSVKSRFSGLFQNTHGKKAQRLLKSAQRYLYHTCSLLCTYFRWRMSVLVLCKISRLFITTLTDDDKYSVLYRENLTQPIQILISQKQRTFSEFLAAFLKPALNFHHFQKKMTLIVDVCPELPSPKTVIR